MMMKRFILLLMIIGIPFQMISAKEDISLPRYPAVSPDAGNIVFSYRSDIWISSIAGGEARRITDHIADDTRPVFSPDGKHIAFSSDRKGNYDVYIIPAAGGLPRQLTFRSSDDFVSDWSSDGKNIIFFPAGISIFIMVISAPIRYQ